MKIIRKKIFETNSSSTHVLAIVRQGSYKIPDHLRFDFGEFGWEYEVYYDTKSKGDYLITLIFCAPDDLKNKWLGQLSDILTSAHINYSFPEPKSTEYDWDEMGYVDHGYEAFDWVEDLLNDKDKLFRFLFNDESYISTGNDNDSGYYIPGMNLDEDISEEEMQKLDEKFDIFWKGN